MEQDRVGQKLGNYLLLRIIGVGGFATVYLGEHIFLKSQAAIKILRTLELTDKARDKFLKEARTIARLMHPHIVRVVECGVEVGASNSTPYIVMNYAARGNVRNAYPQGESLPLDVVLSYVNQAADALQYAHDQSMVHCDIKPENMLLGGADQLLLADFGIANISHTAEIAIAQTNIHSDPTISGDIQGTVTYMAPERFQGQIRRASDQYSLGIVVYEWLMGKPPFTGSRDQVMFQQLTAQPPLMQSRNSPISPEMEQVVLKALEKEPGQRYASVKEFAQELEKAILASPAYVSLHPVPSPTVVNDALNDVPVSSEAMFLEETLLPSNTQTVPERGASSSAPEDTMQKEPFESVFAQDDEPSSTMPDAEEEDAPGESSPFVASLSPSSFKLENSQVPPPSWARRTPSQSKQVTGNQPSPENSAAPKQTPGNQPPLASSSMPLPKQARSSVFPSEAESFFSPAQAIPQMPVEPSPIKPEDLASGKNHTPGGAGYFTRSNGGAQPGNLFHHGLSSSVPLEEEEPARPFSYIAAVSENIFALEPDFARVPEMRSFRRSGWVANSLCAIASGLIAHSLSVFLLGIVAVAAFWLCIRLVKPFIAVLVGMVTATYWGVFGYFLTKWLLTYPVFSSLPLAEIIGGVFLVISAILHIYYVNHRLS